MRRDPATGDVILSRHPADWEGFFALIDRLDLPADFMADRTDGPPELRDPF